MKPTERLGIRPRASACSLVSKTGHLSEAHTLVFCQCQKTLLERSKDGMKKRAGKSSTLSASTPTVAQCSTKALA